MEAYLLIDYTNDFVDEKGSLTLGKRAQQRLPYILQVLQQASAKGDLLCFVADRHLEEEESIEAKLFPPHNLAHSWGAEWYPPLVQFCQAQSKPVHFFYKTHYSAFFQTGLAKFLKQQQVEKVHLLGLCTDICLLHTAISAYYENYAIAIWPQACIATTEEAQATTLTYMKNTLGVEWRECDDLFR